MPGSPTDQEQAAAAGHRVGEPGDELPELCVAADERAARRLRRRELEVERGVLAEDRLLEVA